MAFLTMDIHLIAHGIHGLHGEFFIADLGFLKANNIWVMLIYNSLQLM
jgi:hypothetical protein